MEVARPALAPALLLALALAGPVASARAELRPLDDGRARVGEPSWRDLGRPERREARLLARQGVALLLASSREPSDGLEPPSQVRVEQALARFDRAVAVLADDPELAFYRGVALARFVHEEAGGRARRRSDEAIAELERARALAPDYEPAAVAWQLALVHTREGRFAEAATEYERVRARGRLVETPIASASRRELELLGLFAVPDAGLVDLNLAEVVMLGGDAARACSLYEGALADAERGSLLSALALFGRALAEERSGAHVEAMASALAATEAWAPRADDPVVGEVIARHGALAALHVPGVAFDPRWEIHAYEALAHEARASRGVGSEEAAEAERERARRSLRAFFAVGGERSPYRETAERALARLGAPH